MKLCKDCKHFQPAHQPSQCLHEGNVRSPDYVTGEGRHYEWKFAQFVREEGRMCGNKGKWYEPIAESGEGKV